MQCLFASSPAVNIMAANVVYAVALHHRPKTQYGNQCLDLRAAEVTLRIIL